jgi:hypothetical protein
MAKETSKIVPWNKVIVKTEEISGIPRKQIDEVAAQIKIGIEATAQENQPKRDGDSITLETPFAAYMFTRQPASNVVAADGRTVLRPSCITGNAAMPCEFIRKANIGLIDIPTEEEAEKDKKKEKIA